MLDIVSAGSAHSAAQLGWAGVVRFLHLTPRAFLPMGAAEALTWSPDGASKATVT